MEGPDLPTVLRWVWVSLQQGLGASPREVSLLGKDTHPRRPFANLRR